MLPKGRDEEVKSSDVFLKTKTRSSMAKKSRTELAELPKVDAEANGGVALAEGEARIDLTELRENPDNPQTVTEDEFAKLRDSMARLHGFLRTRPLLVEADGTVKCGNKRLRALLGNGVRFVPSDYVRRLSDYTPDEVREFLLQDNIQRGEWDAEKLLAQYTPDELKNLGGGFDALISEFEGKSEGDSGLEYSSKVEAPHYNVTGENPTLDELYDTGKADDLVREIEAADIPKNVKAFLKVAAMRHVVFDFANIAEYYAHADETVQGLMEKSALVVIDFEDAIRNGFVIVSERMAAFRDAAVAEKGADDGE